MTELIIDGQPVALPDNMILTVKEQNPYITKRGSFSLDLNLSLKDRNNALLYKHLDRMHSSVEFPTRSILLLSDSRVFMNGSEAIQSNTEDNVTIQLLSGNSELNYFINAETFISDLDLGRERELTDDYYRSIISLKFPEANFSPVKVKIDSQVFNYYKAGSGALPPAGTTFERKRIQPYLVGMIVRIIESLGYSITANELLQDEAACRLFFLNPVEGVEYNKFLPGWTAKDFLEECEKFFNITFYIDSKDRSVEILRRRSATTKGVYVINNVLDEYERVWESDRDVLDYNSVEFELPNSKWYKYADIDPGVMQKAEIKTYQTYKAMCTDLSQYLWYIPQSVGEQYEKTFILFYVTENDSYYILQKHGWVTQGGEPDPGGGWYYPRPINRFCQYGSDANSESVKLKFIPAQMANYTTWIKLPTEITLESIPYMAEKVEEEDDDAQNIRHYIENGINDYNATQRRICLAYNEGIRNGSPSWRAVIDYLYDTPSAEGKKTTNQNLTLRLNGDKGLFKRYYQSSDIYDYSKEYVIKFIIRTRPDVRANFLLNNKMFICKELEYTLTNDGVHPIVTGTFYAVK